MTHSRALAFQHTPGPLECGSLLPLCGRRRSRGAFAHGEESGSERPAAPSHHSTDRGALSRFGGRRLRTIPKGGQIIRDPCGEFPIPAIVQSKQQENGSFFTRKRTSGPGKDLSGLRKVLACGELEILAWLKLQAGKNFQFRGHYSFRSARTSPAEGVFGAARGFFPDIKDRLRATWKSGHFHARGTRQCSGAAEQRKRREGRGTDYWQ